VLGRLEQVRVVGGVDGPDLLEAVRRAGGR
jgi:hypothetical protein